MGTRSPIRLKFGVAPVTLYTKPADCGGSCFFCPKSEGLPNSYIENEDTEYAKDVNFSPERQLSRLLTHNLANSMSNGDDIPLEIILLGGSFSALSREYRYDFVQRIYSFLLNAINVSETSFTARCSVLTVESRPDQISSGEVDFLRHLGVSKVEIGVQHTCDEVLRKSGRNHLQQQTIEATSLLKNSGFKVGYHVMLGLPGATLAKDITMLSQSLWYHQYYPDYLKIYPCELLRNRQLQPQLYRLYDQKVWEPPSKNYCLKVLASSAPYIPQHVRISRIQRQFAERDILKGVGSGLREKNQTPIIDIRYREIGFRASNLLFELDARKLICRYYVNVESYFFEVCYQEKDVLVAIARLTIGTKKIPILREIKVFGKAAPIGCYGQVQGMGLGSSLLLAVENKLHASGYEWLYVNAAYGARSFFTKHGYVLNHNDYMEKKISNDSQPYKSMNSLAIKLNFTLGRTEDFLDVSR